MTIKHALVSSLTLLALAVGGCGGDDESGDSGSSSGSAQATVDLKDFKFVPKTVEIEAGGKVTFANADKAKHNAQTANDAEGAFKTTDLLKGDSDTVTFDEPGTYAYYCIYHRFMTGTVEVKG